MRPSFAIRWDHAGQEGGTHEPHPAHGAGLRAATYDPKSRQVFVNVLNRSEKTDITARLENVAGAPSGPVSVWELSHSDLKATHTFGKDALVRPVTRSASMKTAGNAFEYTFPKHSLTILRW